MRVLLLLLVVGQTSSYYEREGNYYEYEHEDSTTKFTTLAEHGYLTRHRRRDPENNARTLSPEEVAGVKGALKKILPHHNLEEIFSSTLPTGADTSTTWYTVKDILSDILGNINLKDDATDKEATETQDRTVAAEHWKSVYKLNNDPTTEIVLGESNEANQTTTRNNSKEVENVPQLGVKIDLNRSTEPEIVYIEDNTDSNESTKAEIVYEEDEKTDAKANTSIDVKPDAKTEAKTNAKTDAKESTEAEIVYLEDKTDAKENKKAEKVYEEEEEKTDVKKDAMTDANETSHVEIVYEEDAKADTEQNTTDKIYVQLENTETSIPKPQNYYYKDNNIYDYFERAAKDHLILRDDGKTIVSPGTGGGSPSSSSLIKTTRMSTKSTTPRKTNKRKRTTTTTKRTRRRKTRTSPKPTAKLDIPKLLEILSNLTQDYSNNLMAALNKSLQGFTLPTCPTFTYTSEPPTTTVSTTTNAYANLTGTIMGKCFVCGLEDEMMPRNAHCADAFQTDFIPLVPVNPQSRGEISKFRKYCRWMNIPKYFINASETRSMWGRWTGGCSVRWIDVSGIYTQRTCRNRHRAVMGRHWGSKRMAKLEMALQHVDNGCVQSPMSSLVPLSRGVSLYARFHACVCTGNWCNRARPSCEWTLFLIISPLILTFLLNT